jgi:hypothetical protein
MSHPMHPEAVAFLEKNRVCVMAIEMPDGSPHAATVHYAATEEPVLLFETESQYRKAEALNHRKVSRASVVVGFTEGANSSTLQMDGEASLVSNDDPRVQSVYLAKFPNKAAKAMKPNTIFFQFKPTWWRFTDWSESRGKRIYTSTD